MDLCDDVDTHLARTIPRICATYKFDAQIHGNVRRCGAGLTHAGWDALHDTNNKNRIEERVLSGAASSVYDAFQVS